MSKQMETFKNHLEEFTSKHKDDIRKNPEFRSQFQEMCASVGVDPLACKSDFIAALIALTNFFKATHLLNKTLRKLKMFSTSKWTFMFLFKFYQFLPKHHVKGVLKVIS